MQDESCEYSHLRSHVVEDAAWAPLRALKPGCCVPGFQSFIFCWLLFLCIQQSSFVLLSHCCRLIFSLGSRLFYHGRIVKLLVLIHRSFTSMLKFPPPLACRLGSLNVVAVASLSQGVCQAASSCTPGAPVL